MEAAYGARLDPAYAGEDGAVAVLRHSGRSRPLTSARTTTLAVA